MSEQLLQDIATRLEAMGESVSEARIRGLVESCLQGMLAEPDNEFVRKIRFGRSDNQLIGSKFARWNLSVGDIEMLYDLMQANERLGRAGPSEELRNAFAAISDAVYIPQERIREIDQRALDDMFPRVPVRSFPAVDRGLAAQGRWAETQAYAQAMRAMDTAESGYGSQLVGAQYVGELWEAARVQSRIFGLLDTFEMTAPTAYLPVEADMPELLYVSENTASNSADYSTTKTGSNRVTVSAAKFVLHQMWSGEMEEDAIIPYLPFLRRQATKSLGHYSDSLVLNGDTTNAGTGNINLDDADPTDTKHYLAFDGIRHVCIVDNTGNQSNHLGAAITWNALKDQQKRMIDRTYLFDWGHPTDPGDLVYLMDPETADAASKMDEVITIDKFGTAATVLTGQLGRIGQHPLIGTIALSLTEADGKVSTTGGNNIYGQSLALNRRGFVVGWRRRVRVETERLPARDQTRIVYSMRLGLGRYSPTGAASGIECADLLYDIGL